MKRLIGVCLMAVLCLMCMQAGAAELALPVAGTTISVHTTELEGEEWLFLPSFADLSKLYPNAVETEEAGVWLDAQTGLRIMQSQNLRTLFLFSADPVNAGRAWVEGCLRHENETTGSMAIISQEGKVDHADALRQLRGRGNGSWNKPKRPYQFKLENRADLLKTGLSSEKARTWVLLAEAADGTYLHNRMALDLGLELGIESTSHSEFVDLYYDGEYCGLYLLAEKVEIDEARMDERDYEKLLESWNKQIGQNDLEALPAASAQNRFGNEYHYIEKVADNGVVDAGAYHLEMESTDFGPTFDERCYFRLSDRSILSVKSPENASEPMVRYISERLMEARQTLDNGGVHPETGRTIEDDFDVDGFARLALLNELSRNLDGFSYSSTYFILPAGETRFQPGPPWDYDLAWRYFSGDSSITEMKGTSGWLEAFYRSDVFMDRMCAVYEQELYPLVHNVLLGGGAGRWLRSVDAYAQEINASRRMNEKLWDKVSDHRLQYADGFEAEIELLKTFLSERSEWLYQALVANRALGADGVQLYFDVRWAYPEEGAQIQQVPGGYAEIVSMSVEQVSEATEEDYAVYEVELIFAAEEGYAFENPRVMVNDRPMSSEIQEDGTLRVQFSFEDLSYRPVDYYGDDIGLIYNPDIYAAHYPEIAAEYEDDPEGLMDYFCDEGMYVGHRGNQYFDPQRILLFNPHLTNMFGEDWQNYYWDFLYYGFDEGWLWNIGDTYRPELVDLLS